MSNLQYSVYEGFGERVKKEVGSSQAVRIGDQIQISGQGGWDRITEEISSNFDEEVDQAFANVEHILQQAGAKGFEQVYKVYIYYTPSNEETLKALGRNIQKWFPTHQPILTALGVEKLALEGMHVEIEVAAYLGP